MKHVFCFQCNEFVEVMENNELTCGHQMADQQSVYNFMIGRIDAMLKEACDRFNLRMTDQERRHKAMQITLDFVVEFFEKKLQG
jgi:hypothetical protein